MIHKGEIWVANLDPTIGQEINKTRPVLILGKHPFSKREIYIVVPITGWDEDYAQSYWMRKMESTGSKFVVRIFDSAVLVDKTLVGKGMTANARSRRNYGMPQG